jgi:hypothetical protein
MAEKIKKSIRLRNLKKFLENPAQHITRSSAIRLKCLDCVGDQLGEVEKCESYKCPLWGYRSGHGWQQPGSKNE